MNSAIRPRLLINCSNLHVGGGVAVAASFIDQLAARSDHSFEITLLLSSAVATNLNSLGAHLESFAQVEIRDFRGLRSLWQGLSKCFAGYDVIFTVFGPAYSFGMGERHVCGFAQPWIIYPRNPAQRGMRRLARLKQRLKFQMQELFFARADEIIVELEHVKTGLKRKALFRKKPIHVVYNTVDSIFVQPSRWTPVLVPTRGSAIRLGIVSRNYKHKNLECLPALRRILSEEHQLNVEFFVTFTDKEWLACSEKFRNSVNNVGALVLSQCPNFYAAMDGVIFPSFLECFSAVPLEAMSMRKPLFASDLPFIRDCCHDHAYYFDPLDVVSMAHTVATYFKSGATDAHHAALDHAYRFARGFSSADERARSYLAIAEGTLLPR